MNNSTFRRLLGVIGLTGAALLAGSGCVATTTGGATREANQREDYALVNEKMRRLEGDTESLRLQIERLNQDLQRIQANAANAAENQAANVQSALATVESRINTLEAQREADRREIVDTLSRKVAELVNAQAPPPARSGNSGPTPAGYGYEHIVQAGETLSRIAQAYETTVSAVLKANNLQNADALKIGQKLFIPE